MNEWIFKFKECMHESSQSISKQSLTYLFKLFMISLSPLGSVLSVEERKLLKLGRSVLEFQLVQIQVDVFFYNIYHWCRSIVQALDLLIMILWSIQGILGPVYMESGTPVWWGWFLLFSRSGRHKTKETYPTRPGSPTPCKQGLKPF